MKTVADEVRSCREKLKVRVVERSVEKIEGEDTREMKRKY